SVQCTSSAECFIFVLAIRAQPRSTLFPYTTLFRSQEGHDERHAGRQQHHEEHGVEAVGQRVAELLQHGGRHLLPGGTGLDMVSPDRKSTRLNSSHVKISYAVFCLKKKKK